jgi:ABC-type Fe3+ transport system permease subunit
MHRDMAVFAGGSSDRADPGPGFDEQVFRRTAGAARNSFGWAFRAAMLLILLAIPFTLTMRRSPAQARAAAMAAMQEAQPQAAPQPLTGRNA